MRPGIVSNARKTELNIAVGIFDRPDAAGCVTVADDDVFARASCLGRAYKSRMENISVLAFNRVILLVIGIEIKPEAALLIACNLALFGDQLRLDGRFGVTPREDDKTDNKYRYQCDQYDDGPVHLLPPLIY